MKSYKKPYLKLFGALEDVIEEINNLNFGKAKEILINAQQEAEEIIISDGEDKNTK